ncbi:hypothetical protein H5410_027540 [Solanum commersonii]|uniref:Uncharacterized protein n=1 Tax=Solanum commersonii TaxID=4109 RepID=A0A9J5Z256_SOLCO|nr:hypothetical protein H5410_027540 [Solanum commersonii]
MSPSLCPYAAHTTRTPSYKSSQNSCFHRFTYQEYSESSSILEKISINGFPVPSLEHNYKVTGESLDLVKYVDSNFEGPLLLPDDLEKRKFVEELIAYSDTTFVLVVYSSFAKDAQTLAGAQFPYLEKALHKFDDGPFFLNQFSQVGITYAPFIKRFQNFLPEGFNYDITTGRPKLSKWIEEMSKLDGYKQTKVLE